MTIDLQKQQVRLRPKQGTNFDFSQFEKAFNDKGRLSNLMKTMPVKIVLNDQAALFGAARYAVDRADMM